MRHGCCQSRQLDARHDRRHARDVVRHQGLDPRTRCFKIVYVDWYPLVRKTSDYLEILRTVIAG